MSIPIRLLTLANCFLLVSASTSTNPAAANWINSTSRNVSSNPASGSISKTKSASQSNDESTFFVSEKPVHGVRKMSPDAGEKFFFDDWWFVDDSHEFLPEQDIADVDAEDPPLALFIPQTHPFQEAISGSRHGWLESRDFKCPTDTHACTNIHRSDRCCGLGSTCELVKDTGAGDVGCCANGKACSGVVGSCQRGYTACSRSLGGGCCIPGYDCVPGGCEYDHISYFLAKFIHWLMLGSGSGALISVVTVTIDSSVVVTTRTHYSTTAKSPGTSSRTETTDHLVPPALPTSRSTTTHATTSRASICPTGFYACSAVYHGGCCQTGRDCDTTSCPTTSSKTLTSDGVTVVVPVSAGGESQSPGRCARGWFSCADTAGGGCCPTGYACGSSCTATAAGATVAKEQATNNSAMGRKIGVVWWVGVLWVWIW